MTLPAPTYDLVLLLDPQVGGEHPREDRRRHARPIEAQGELLRHDEWGERALTYPIDKKPNAEYHLLQFHAGSAELLDGLDRTLRITDGVMRFRLIKLAPGVPEAPEMRRRDRDRAPGRAGGAASRAGRGWRCARGRDAGPPQMRPPRTRPPRMRPTAPSPSSPRNHAGAAPRAGA